MYKIKLKETTMAKDKTNFRKMKTQKMMKKEA
jgi:hypothetical protein